MNHIVIALATDANYINPTATLIASILKNAKKDTFVEFHILYTGLSAEDKTKFLEFDIEGRHCEFIFWDMEEIINKDLDNFMSRRQEYSYISTATYYRFYLPQLLKEYERVLYLDTDMIVLEDLTTLFNIDLTDKYAAVVNDPYMEKHLEDHNVSPYNGMTFNEYFTEKLKKENNNYFNAGMILFNLNLIRQYEIVKDLWEYVEDNSPLVFQDQDALNVILEEKLLYVNQRFNVFPQFMYKYKQKSIIHFVGKNKPQDSDNIPMWQEYWKYFRMTPFYTFEKEIEFLKKINYVKNINIELFGFRICTIKFPICDKFNLKFLQGFLPDDRTCLQKRIKQLTKKYKGKKVVIYGLDPKINYLFDNIDISEIDLAGVTDKTWLHGLTCYKGSQIIPVGWLKTLKFDVLFVSGFNFRESLEYLQDKIFMGSPNYNIRIERI